MKGKSEEEHGIYLRWPEAAPLTPIEKLKQALVEIAGDDTRKAIKLVERVFEAIPELREL